MVCPLQTFFAEHKNCGLLDRESVNKFKLHISKSNGEPESEEIDLAKHNCYIFHDVYVGPYQSLLHPLENPNVFISCFRNVFTHHW